MQNIQYFSTKDSAGIFQCKIFSQPRHSRSKKSNHQGIFQFKTIQFQYFSTKYAAGRNIPVQNIQSARTFQVKKSTFGISAQKIQSAGTLSLTPRPALKMSHIEK
jgi:hypothetical protein